ncbi:unnamed protein product, partial [Sphacelaria rigidula]
MVLNPTANYLSGCYDCSEYANGSAVVRDRLPAPLLESARFANAGSQVIIEFTGSDSSQEINGSYSAVPCEDVFSAASASTLGIGCTSQFSSPSTLMVTLGKMFDLRPSTLSHCTDGDGTSIFLRNDTVRTEIGALLSTPGNCVAVNNATDMSSPVMTIFAARVVGSCDDVNLEANVNFALSGKHVQVTTFGALALPVLPENVALCAHLSRAPSQANANNELRVTLPSSTLSEGATYTITLNATSELGASSQESVNVTKSTQELPVVKVLGPSILQHPRGRPLVVNSQTSASSCATSSNEAAYSWRCSSSSAISNASVSTAELLDVLLDEARNPRIASLPSFSLGYAGSAYTLQLGVTVGETRSTANITVEVIAGSIVAAIDGGTRRTIGSSQALILNASSSIDEDDVDLLPFTFEWKCADPDGGTCASPNGYTLDVDHFADGERLAIPAGNLTVGAEYVFDVYAYKGYSGEAGWRELRGDNATCSVSVSASSVPHVAVWPKEILRKYNPSSQLVLYGCASTSAESVCSSSIFSGFEFEWTDVEGTIDLTGGWEHVFSTAVDSPILVARAGTLAPGRSYTFTLTASDTFGSMGYADITIDTNAPPVGGYIACDRSSIVAGVDEVLLHSIGWTDDYEDLPIMHSFGYVHGYREVTSIASASTEVTKISTGWSPSSLLSTHVPPGLASDNYNITVAVFVSDVLGSRAVTSLGEDGWPITVVSTPPTEDAAFAVALNLSAGLAAGGDTVTDPEDALRRAHVASNLLANA